MVRVEAGFLSSGSGFIFDVEGTTAFVATNYHVIRNADAVDVTVRGTRTYEALILGWDADRDVAVLAICCSDSFVIIPWEEASPEVVAEVVAVGYPRGGSRSQVTATLPRSRSSVWSGPSETMRETCTTPSSDQARPS